MAAAGATYSNSENSNPENSDENYSNHSDDILEKVSVYVAEIVKNINTYGHVKESIRIEVGRHYVKEGNFDKGKLVFGAKYTIPRLKIGIKPFEDIFELPNLKYFYKKVKIVIGKIKHESTTRHLVSKDFKKAPIDVLTAQYITKDIMTKLYNDLSKYQNFENKAKLKESIDNGLRSIPLKSPYLFSLTSSKGAKYNFEKIEEKYEEIIASNSNSKSNNEAAVGAAGAAAGGAEAPGGEAASRGASPPPPIAGAAAGAGGAGAAPEYLNNNNNNNNNGNNTMDRPPGGGRRKTKRRRHTKRKQAKPSRQTRGRR
jgi:hypothetical protein